MIPIKGALLRRRARRADRSPQPSLGREKAHTARRESERVLTSVENRWPGILALSGARYQEGNRR